MEVQIRTREMHRNAELGIAAHWKYKEGLSGDRNDDEQKFAWLRQLLDRHQELSDPHEFLDALKVDLFPDEVFVFTPKGDVINLPKGSTPVDFAYAIHTEVGEHCSGARVNGKIVPLRHVLADGDTLEIMTSESQVPRKDWLDFVVSGKARSKVRHAIRVAEQARSRELGRDILEKELRRVGLSLARLLESGALAELAGHEVSGSPDDLFSAIGYGRLAPAAIVAKLRGDAAPEPEPAPKRRRRIFGRERVTPPSTGISVDGISDVLVRFANCCNPLPGDDVIGFVTRGRGVTVHVRDCQHAFTLDPDRRIDVQWEAKSTKPRLVRVRAVSVDQPGVLAKITKSIAGTHVNIGAARVSTNAADQTAIHEFDLWVTDLRALTGVMKEIERVRGVLSVERVRT
jgi:GTP pyrophosphokinase